MAKIEKSISIDALVEKVFVFMAEPNNLPEIWYGLNQKNSKRRRARS